MLTAEIAVRYEGDWTAKLKAYDVTGEFLASTFQQREYIGIIALQTEHLEAAIDTVREHHTVDAVDIIERYSPRSGATEAATLFLEGQLREFSPLQTLLYEGFLPLGPTELVDGRECFGLLLRNREELARAVGLLEEFGSVSIERVSSDFSREVMPSAPGWQELLGAFSSRQREVLDTALELGYYEIPRGATLAEVAEASDITKTTASKHLRKAEARVLEFLMPYLNLAAQGP